MSLPELYAKYMAAQVLSNAELEAFESKLKKLCELLFGMGFDPKADAMFIQLNRALMDAQHMQKSRLTSGRK